MWRIALFSAHFAYGYHRSTVYVGSYLAKTKIEETTIRTLLLWSLPQQKIANLWGPKLLSFAFIRAKGRNLQFTIGLWRHNDDTTASAIHLSHSDRSRL